MQARLAPFQLTWARCAFLLAFWLLLYVEPIQMGPLKLSQLWKGAVLFVMLVGLLRGRIPAFAACGLLFSAKFLIYTEIPYGIVSALQDCLEALVFPVFVWFFINRERSNPRSSDLLTDYAILGSLFILYSTVPFLMGVKPLNPIRDLSAFDIDAIAVNGIFYHIATSSKLFTIATLVIFIARGRFQRTLLYRLAWATSVALGIYLIYASWTRTAWFIFAMTFLVVIFYGVSWRRRLVGLLIACVAVLSVAWLYENDQAFRWRLSGGAIYRQDAELSVESLTAARLPFVLIALENLREKGLSSQLIGYGSATGIDLFEQKTGMAINSHNRTTEILESSGLVGLALYLAFLLALSRILRRGWTTASLEQRRFLLASTLLFSGYFLSSHGTPIFGEVIFACFIAAAALQRTRVDQQRRVHNTIYAPGSATA